MIFMDKWTLRMVVFTLAKVVLTLLSKKKRSTDLARVKGTASRAYVRQGGWQSLFDIP